MRRLCLALLLLACGEPAAPATSALPSVDRSEGERPAGIVLEVALDGGDAALVALAGQLPPISARAALPTHVSVLLDGLIETPTEIRSRVSPSSPVRLLMARVDGELRSAVAVRLDEPVPASERHSGGPRGADRVGTNAAVDDRIAVVSDDPALLDLAFAYLAYGALARPSEPGAIVASIPASTLRTTVRSALTQALDERRRGLLGSIAAARAAHDRPPDFGDPEQLVTLVNDALVSRLAYLPDLGDATVTLSPTPSGLALTMSAQVTDDSPLALALGMRTAVAPSFVAAMPSASALVLATGTTAASRTASSDELAEAIAAIGGTRVSASERTALDEVSRSIASIRGDEGAMALGATDTNGVFAITLGRGATAAAAPSFWGRPFVWTRSWLGALAGCAIPATATTTLCGEASLATRSADGARADALGRDAEALAEAARLALATDARAESPDLARDLAALPSGSFALLLVRPLRLLPILAAVGGPPRAGLPRGDGAAVLALAQDHGRLSVSLRASTAAMADLDVVVRLFADETDSE